MFSILRSRLWFKRTISHWLGIFTLSVISGVAATYVHEHLFYQNSFQKTGAETAKGQVALTVRSNVDGDTVFIDDKRYGSTRLDIPLIPGHYIVRVEKEGYQPFEQHVDLRTDMTLWARLEKATPTLVGPAIYNESAEIAWQKPEVRGNAQLEADEAQQRRVAAEEVQRDQRGADAQRRYAQARGEVQRKYKQAQVEAQRRYQQAQVNARGDFRKLASAQKSYGRALASAQTRYERALALAQTRYERAQP